MPSDSAAQRLGSDADASLPLTSVPDGPSLRAHEGGADDPYAPDAIRAPLVEHSRLLAGVFVATIIAVGAYRVFGVKREYNAEVVIATVTNAKTVPGLSGLAASLGAATSPEGLSPTPDMMVAFIRSNAVLTQVGGRRLSVGKAPLAALLDGSAATDWTDTRIVKAMHNRVSALVDRRTGLITVAVASADSASARAAVGSVIQAASDRFVSAARAQAALQAQGMQALVDTAAQRLQNAEAAYTDFLSHNRTVAPFSVAAVQRDRLQRDIDIARAVYNQAITDRESAKGRMLQETPSVVVVDDVPKELPGLSRHTAYYALLSAAVVTALLGAGLVLAPAARRRRAA